MMSRHCYYDVATSQVVSLLPKLCSDVATLLFECCSLMWCRDIERQCRDIQRHCHDISLMS